MADLLREITNIQRPTALLHLFAENKYDLGIFNQFISVPISGILQDRPVKVADIDQFWFSLSLCLWEEYPYSKVKSLDYTKVTPEDQNCIFFQTYYKPTDAKEGHEQQIILIKGGKPNKKAKTSKYDGLVQFFNACRDFKKASKSLTSTSSSSSSSSSAPAPAPAPPSNGPAPPSNGPAPPSNATEALIEALDASSTTATQIQAGPINPPRLSVLPTIGGYNVHEEQEDVEGEEGETEQQVIAVDSMSVEMCIVTATQFLNTMDLALAKKYIVRLIIELETARRNEVRPRGDRKSREKEFYDTLSLPNVLQYCIGNSY